MTTIHAMRRALMAAQQARHHPEQQADCHPTPIITRQCNTQHIRPDQGYTRRIRVRRCRLRLMPRLLPGNRIEELASCHDYRLLKDTPIPVGRLRRRHTGMSHKANHHHSLPQRTLALPYRTGLEFFVQRRLLTLAYKLSVPSRRTPTSPTSGIRSRSLPVPPTPLSAKPPIPPLPIVPKHSSPA
ncbi:hypothetical protein EDB83DRAFT_1829998 [Lactarius deliciosus]|nr:hypothetical protein EDB83DRAFT_1829998 [Lactarius deliciosus]